MNILLLNWRDLRNRKAGGAEIVTHEYAKRWVQKGHKVTLFTSRCENAPTHETLDGVEIIRQGGPYTVHLWAFWRYLTQFKSQYDVIVDQIHGIPFFTPLYVRDRHIVAFVHEVAGNIWHYMYPFPLDWIGLLIERLHFKFYRNVQYVTGSPSTQEDLVRMGIKRSQIEVVHYGVAAIPLEHLPLKNEEPTVIFVGRLCRMKRVEEALEAFSVVLASLPTAKLWIVGTGEKQYVQNLQQRVQRLKLDSAVRFWGFVSEEEKLDLMRRAHVLIHPSVKEGWGLAIIEANTQGTPAVGYDVSGLRDSIQDGKTGLLVTPHDPKYLAEAVIRLLKDNDYREYLSSNALEWSRQFGWDEAANKFLRIIEATRDM